MNKKNNRKGFTIVELVIVIAVIAILATVLVPTFGDVISKANASKLLQELRNEYTSYTLEAEGEFSDVIYILYKNNYYKVTSGNPDVSSESSTAPTEVGAVIWDADANSYTTVTAPTQAPTGDQTTGG